MCIHKNHNNFFKNRFLMIKKTRWEKKQFAEKYINLIICIILLDMPPKRNCSSKHHAYCCTLFPNEDEVVYRISDRKIRRSVIDLLIQKEHIFFHSTFLCNICAKLASSAGNIKKGHKKLPLTEDSQFSIFSMNF